MVHHSNDDAMNKIPLKSSSGLDDDEKNGGELIQDTAAAEEARREQMRANVLAWMKKLTIVLICFIGIALISYVIISLCFSDEQPEHNESTESTTATTAEEIAIAGPAIAASTSPTTPPPSPATNVDNNKEFSSTLGVFENAAVCSDMQPCSQIGSDILARNGSAVDATIATMLCNGLLTSQSMGIGGGLLMNIYERETGQSHYIDAQVVAPYASKQNMFDDNYNASIVGPLSIAVPGEVMGYHRAHQKFGKLPWQDLVAPSLKLCETGYQMSKHQENSVRRTWSHIKDNPHYQVVFLNAETGEQHVEGALLKPPAKLCNTYQLLSDNGPMDFYNGTVAKMLAEDLNELGSIITLDDLAAYTAEMRLSITSTLGKDTLYAVPPVSSGSVISHILSILEGYNLTRADLADEESYARTIHRITEALKFGFARRPELGDPRFIDVRELVSQLNNPDSAAEQRAKINDSYVLSGPQEYGALSSYEEDPYGTSALSVIAPNGDAVSVTSSINYYFGSGLIGPRTGIILNDCMADFAMKGSNQFKLPASPANTIELHKRPMSSQSPMLLTDQEGNVRLAIGAAGGSKILAAIVEVAARYLWLGDDLKAAVDAPRFYSQLFPDTLEYEDGKYSESLLQLLQKRGHNLLPLKTTTDSVVCALARNATAIYANADYRKRGGVAGF
ncbi:scoloptoxin SSD14 [Drosophila grimshawi]|uniref:scoloptoxin SSD14 n=1 Tax=Drosophila grimshawi TaxID=7222 RepID=UPI000C870425|nr:scoloptoxin SSD14 [Drosophila grimshawi]